MRLTHRQALILATCLALALGWTAFQDAERETAVLRVFDGAGKDYFTTVWVVDDRAGFSWIRAHRPDRQWLTHIEDGSSVELRRAGRSQRYVARPYDDDQTRAYVDPLFRDKYGLADRWRELTAGADTIPVRLQAR